MRTTLHTAAVATAVVLVAASAQPALAAPPTTTTTTTTTATDGSTWSPALATGSGSGVTVVGGGARIDPRTAFLAPPDSPAAQGADGGGSPTYVDGRNRSAPSSAVRSGLLTLAQHVLPAATDHIVTSVAAKVVPGATATVDVRGLRATGNWSEWIPAGADDTVVLPESAARIQARLVLTGDPGPVVTAVTLTAAAPSRTEGAAAAGAPLTYRVYATREGLPGGTTANGHVIGPHDHFVALPSRRALSPDGTSDYSVRVCAPNGRCAFAPVWDVGPWNTHDDYWNPATDREQWTDLPQGTPQAQAAYRNSYNGGNDQFGRHVVNPAGIDLGDGVFWDDLGLVTNTTVTVDYLWTGDVRLAKVVDTGPVLAAPEPDAKVVGTAADEAGVPVQCAIGEWLRIGRGQYLPAAAVPDPGQVDPC